MRFQYPQSTLDLYTEYVVERLKQGKYVAIWYQPDGRFDGIVTYRPGSATREWLLNKIERVP